MNCTKSNNKNTISDAKNNDYFYAVSLIKFDYSIMPSLLILPTVLLLHLTYWSEKNDL